MERSRDRLEIAADCATILALVFAVVTYLWPEPNMSQALRVLLTLAYVTYSALTALHVLKSGNLASIWHKARLLGLYSFTALFFYLVGTWMSAPTAHGPTLTPPEQKGTILFEDDFENGTAIWKTAGGSWVLRVDDARNSLLCVIPDNGHEYVTAGSHTWSEYALELDVMILEYSDGGDGALVGVHDTRDLQSLYECEFARTWTSLSKYVYDTVSQDVRRDWSATATQGLTLGPWHSVRIEVKPPGVLVFHNGEPILWYNDEDYLKQGRIRLGATPHSEVCFDNVRVIALEPVD